MRLKTKDIENNLLKKGFMLQNTHHRYFVFIYDGAKKDIRTRISHSHDEIGNDLISQMSKQLSMTKSFFKEFIECTKSELDYIQVLKGMGKIK